MDAPFVRVQAGAIGPDPLPDGFGAAHNTGAIVTFSGQCRSEAGQLSALELEHYPGMAEAQLRKIADEAAKRWELQALAVLHRYGRIEPGETIVFVATAAKHRRSAFEAAEFIMDFLKTDAPFWKKEHRVDGAEGGWVADRRDDDQQKQRWEA